MGRNAQPAAPGRVTVSLAAPAPPDPVTAACARIALLVASSQPFYPLYVYWLVGGDWAVSFWTWLSTPAFTSIAWIARRHPAAARALLPLTGIANGLLSAKAFGEASAVELFLAPCALIALLATRGATRIGVAAATAAAALLHGHYGAPFGSFDADQYRAFARLNATSAGLLTLIVLWTLSRARRASGTG